jgi:hypothetical protein
VARKTRIRKGENLSLALTPAERTLLLEELPLLPRAVEQAIHASPRSRPLVLTRDVLNDLAGHVAAAANHAADGRRRTRLNRIFRKINGLLETHTNEPGPEAREGSTSAAAEETPDTPVADSAVILRLPKRSKKPQKLYPLNLTASERESLLETTRLRPAIKNKIRTASRRTRTVELTRSELEKVAEEVEEALGFAPEADRKRLDAVLNQLEALEENKPNRPRRPPVAEADRIYQLKITLRNFRPPVWRRIQVPNGSLGELHQIIQIAMGWTDSHLHEFIVRGVHYGPEVPDQLGFSMDLDNEDEEGVRLSHFIRGSRKVGLRYVYDFGDGWEHDIEFEQIIKREPKVEYPRCVAGARACPPEDVGGPWGYADFLDAIADPKHERHDDLMEWIGGEFDPEAFSADDVNEVLRQFF